MLQSQTLWELIEQRAQLTPELLFAVDEKERSLDFAAYRTECLACAAGLADQGISADSRVSWVLPTCLESLVLIGALARLGARQNPILPIYREREIRFITNQSDCELLIVPPDFRGFDYAKMANQLVEETNHLKSLVVDSRLPKGDINSLPAFRPSPQRSGESPFSTQSPTWLFYTSGTTADPKGVLHSDPSLLAYSRGMAECLSLIETDRIALVFPVTHIGGAGWLMAGLMTGAAQISVSIFDPESTPTLLAKHGVTQAAAGTAFHQAYLEAQRRQGHELLFPSVRAFPGGGAPKPPQLHIDIKREMGGAGIVSGYGLTECPTCTMNRVSDPDEKLANTEGRANPRELEIRVVTSDGNEAEASEEGEVRVRGPQLFQGYLDPDLMREAFDDKGYFRTGDIGTLDPDGFLTITGRLKDVIVRKGENISAKEIEDLLHAHPRIHEAAVIGLPDPNTGERACAVIVLTEDSAALSLSETTEFLRTHQLMTQKLPEQLEIVEALPRNATGKVLKHELQEQFRSHSQ
ncbi:MAG: AMP-binding protein [Myxococcota bacterium]|nr:AMP-binding protein [Myxococcota bacterium]